MAHSTTPAAAPARTAARTTLIRELNDWLRTTGQDGRILVTPGIIALGAEAVLQVLAAVAAFDAFTIENDYYGEHDFGSLDIADRRVMFKIDYYDHSLSAHSSDAADPSVTCRVMTIMLASEY